MSGLLFALACIVALVANGCATKGFTASGCAWIMGGKKVTDAGLLMWWRAIAWTAVALTAAGVAGWLIGRGG